MFIDKRGNIVDIEYIKYRTPTMLHVPEFLDRVDYKPKTSWKRTFIIFPKNTIAGTKRNFCFLYKRTYENSFQNKASLYAESEFDILKLNEKEIRLPI